MPTEQSRLANKPNFNFLKRLRNVKRLTFASLSWIVTLAAGRAPGRAAHDRIVAWSQGPVPAPRELASDSAATEQGCDRASRAETKGYLRDWSCHGDASDRWQTLPVALVGPASSTAWWKRISPPQGFARPDRGDAVARRQCLRRWEDQPCRGLENPATSLTRSTWRRAPVFT